MADIELVIKIPREMYKWVYDVNKFFNNYGTGDFIDLIKNGTQLPKGHGRLVDADAIKRKFISYGYDPGKDVLDEEPTIIEADGGDVKAGSFVTKDEQALEAAKIIRDYCNSFPLMSCKGCVFDRVTGCTLKNTTDFPETWELNDKIEPKDEKEVD